MLPRYVRMIKKWGVQDIIGTPYDTNIEPTFSTCSWSSIYNARSIFDDHFVEITEEEFNSISPSPEIY